MTPSQHSSVPWPPGSPSDLLTLTGHGDRAAFAAFYDQTIKHTLGLIRRVLKDPSQSEEVAQEVYLEIWQHAARFDGAKSSATSVLFTVARRRAIDRVRASQASRNRDVIVGIRDTPDSYDHVAESIEISVEYQRARRAMKHLTAKQREVIELVHDHQLTPKEAALRLGIPPGTLKTRLRDSLIALRRELQAAA